MKEGRNRTHILYTYTNKPVNEANFYFNNLIRKNLFHCKLKCEIFEATCGLRQRSKRPFSMRQNHTQTTFRSHHNCQLCCFQYLLFPNRNICFIYDRCSAIRLHQNIFRKRDTQNERFCQICHSLQFGSK